MTCDHCGRPMRACVSASEGMQVRHWYCTACGHDCRAIGRERLLTEDDLRRQALDELVALGQAMGDYGDPVKASIDAFVEMRLESNTARKGYD